MALILATVVFTTPSVAILCTHKNSNNYGAPQLYYLVISRTNLVEFIFSKVTKIDKIFTIDLTFTT